MAQGHLRQRPEVALMAKGGMLMAAMTKQEARTWGMFCHLGAFAGYIIPFGNIFAPLVIWLVKRDESPLVAEQGKESINFQLTMTLYAIIAGILVIVLIGFLLLFALMVFDVIMVIVATVRVNAGEKYRYPLNIRFIT
jgi:uncharacterized Tic20 family protein